MKRIHLTDRDLAAIRVAPSGNPAVETLLAIRQLLRGDGRTPFGRWRESTRPRLKSSSHARTLRPLVPTPASVLDLLIGCGAVSSVDHALGLRRCPHQHVTEQAPGIGHRGSGPARRPGYPDAKWLDQVEAAIRSAYDLAIAPLWPRMRAWLEIERAAYGEAFLEAGVPHMLDRLHPWAVWKPPVLEVLDGKNVRDIPLNGRSLLIVPSFFCWPGPECFCPFDDSAPLWLIVPTLRDPVGIRRVLSPPSGGNRALSALLGRTRAAGLEAVADGCTTSELSRRLGISASSASLHATVLRNAGLISTRRAGKAVHHTLTPLGSLLISGTGPVPRSLGVASAPAE